MDEKKNNNQNSMLGFIGGIRAVAIGAAIVAIITALTNYQVGWTAIGVGCLVAFAVQVFGKARKDFGGVAEFPYPFP